MAIIEIKSLTKTFGKIQAVRGIDLNIEKGEIFGLLGPNGAGKTTTIGMLCTIVRPTSGSATLAGFDVVKNPAEVPASGWYRFSRPHFGYGSYRP